MLDTWHAEEYHATTRALKTFLCSWDLWAAGYSEVRDLAHLPSAPLPGCLPGIYALPADTQGPGPLFLQVGALNWGS